MQRTQFFPLNCTSVDSKEKKTVNIQTVYNKNISIGLAKEQFPNICYFKDENQRLID